MRPAVWMYILYCLLLVMRPAAADPPAADPAAVNVAGLQSSAEAGDRVAQYNLGVLHETGQYGVREDKAEAVRWYRLSAPQGYENAQYNLAVMYLRGEGVEQDREAAIRWFRLAAEQLNPAAMAALETLGEAVPAPAGAPGE